MSDLPHTPQEPTDLAVRAPPPPAPAADEEVLSLQNYLRTVVRRRWLITATALTILFLGAVQVLTTTPLYTSVASIQIDPEDLNILPYEDLSGSSQRNNQYYLGTQVRNLQTRTLARRVIRHLELAEDLAFTARVSRGVLRDRFFGMVGWVLTLGSRRGGAVDERALIDRFLHSIQVENIRYTRLLSVRFSSTSPELSARVLDATLEEFIEQHLESKYDATITASEFLHRQLRDLKVAVESTEESLITYARKNNIVNLNERESINQQKLADLSDELTRVEAVLIAKTARYQAIRKVREDHFPDTLQDGNLRELERRSSELERQRASFSERYGSEWPEVKQTESELQEVRRQLEDSRQQTIERARYEYEVTVNRRDRLRDALSDQRVVVDQLNEDSIQYNIQKRDVETNKELYEGLLQRLKEAGVAAGLRSSNIRIVDPATVPAGPSSPRKFRALVAAGFWGLVLGLVAAFVVEMLDNTLKTTEDVVKHLGMTPLGVIPMLGSPNGKGRRRPTGGKKPSPLLPDPTSAGGRAFEAYRDLRTTILLSSAGQPPQVMLVSSALPGEGKTTTVANIGVALAQTGARTLLIDLDLRRPALAKLFGVSRKQGMSSVLAGGAELSSQIRETRFANLNVLPSGPSAPNPVELIGSRRMAEALKDLRERYTYVVIDSPPFLELTDALEASRWVDGVILVAHGAKTPREAVRKAGERLYHIGAPLLGVVLNNVDLRKLSYGYSYYSYYYNDYYGARVPAARRGARRAAPGAVPEK